MGILKLLAVLCIAIMLPGCSWMPKRIVYVPPCVGWSQINPTRNDVAVMSDSLGSQILTHNVHGARTCNWKPPSKNTGKSS